MTDVSISPAVDTPMKSLRRKRIRVRREDYSEGVLSSSTATSTSDSSASPSSSLSPESSAENLVDLEVREGRGLVVDEGACVSHGCASVMGRRREMEDAVRAELDFARRFDYFGVFDGHGGAQVAEACGERMHRIVAKEICRSADEAVDWEDVMTKCFEKMDEEIGAGNGGGSVGSTAVVALVGKEEIIVANCGDSRAVICRNGTALPLTVDHKPDRPDELARIESEGGKVINWNGHRVLGVLATSRSIGDNYLKPYVIPTPEVAVYRRSDDDEFLILASDGLWDVVSNEMACQVARRCLSGRIQREVVFSGGGGGGCRAERAASVLVELALARGGADNISVVVVELKRGRKLRAADGDGRFSV